jgi:hypothetical protein
MLHAVALHQQHLGRKHGQRVVAYELHRQLAQALKLVAMKHHKTGGVGARHVGQNMQKKGAKY